nr:Lar family restriction alleviation protein [Delftia sp. CH05]
MPCPFCGGPVRVLFKRVSNRRSGHFAECRTCEVRQGQPQPSRDAAVENWNRRAKLEARKPLPPDALADKCEAWLQAGGASNIVDAFEAGYRAAERAEEGNRK